MPLGAARITLLARSAVTAVAEVIRKKIGITAYNNAKISTIQSKFGGASARFDGTGDYIDTAISDSFDISGDFTIEFWTRPSATANEYIIHNRGNGTNLTGQFSIRIFSGTLYLSPYNISSISGGTLSTGTWYHIAFVRSGSTIALYKNGVSQGTATWTDNLGATYKSFRIGAFSADTSDYYGDVDEVRVSNTARYTANFTPSTTPFVNDANTLLLLHMDGTDGSTYFEDDNGVRSKNGITAVGNAQVDTAQSKFGGASALFDGTGDYLTIPYSTDWLGSDMTYEFWIRADTNASNPGLISFYSGTNGGFVLAWAEYDDTIKWLGASTGTNNPTVRASTGGVTKNVWNHVAFVVTGGTVKAYLNGVGGSTGTYVPAAVTSGTPLKIATGTGISTTWSGTNYLNGWLDEIRISNTVRYTANFTPSTTPFVNDENTLLLIHANGTDGSTVFCDDNGVRSQAGVWAQGGANLSTAAYKFGNSSAYFNGTSTDYFNYNTHQSITGDFTIEGWVRFLGVPSTGDNGFMIFWLSNSSNYINFYGTNSLQLAVGGKYGTVSLPTTPAINTWYHLAVVRNSGEYKVYWNGVDAGAFTNDSGWPASGTYDWLGAGQFGKFTDARGDWYGYMDEIRLSNTARYTSNFTAPTEPFQNDSNTLLLLHMDGTNASTVFVDDNGVPPDYSY